jgi:hypothetical protein
MKKLDRIQETRRKVRGNKEPDSRFQLIARVAVKIFAMLGLVKASSNLRSVDRSSLSVRVPITFRWRQGDAKSK